MKLRTFAASALLFAGAACQDDLVFAPPDPDSFVVQAFLFAGEPVAGVTVTGVLPIDADSTAVAPSISDANVAILSMQDDAGTDVSSAVICMNRRGRMLLMQATGDWQPLQGGVRILIERVGLGLQRELWIPQGGVSGVWR